MSDAAAIDGTHVQLTVAICTWNRSHLLRETLEHMTRLIVPAGVEWELLVIDNNSTDDTRSVVEQLGARLPLRYFFERQPGLSNARNTAVAQARGAYVIWTDDDVIVDPHWLEAYAGAFDRYRAAVMFGGPILPWFEGEPPSWLRAVFSKVDVAYAAREFTDGDAPLSEARMPFGANMAFRMDVLKAHPFDAALGRTGSGMLGGEETAIVRACIANGREGRWVSGARVQHFVPSARQSIGYLRGWYAGYGQTLVRLEPGVPEASSTSARRRPRWIWREVIVSELLFRWRKLTTPPTVWIADLKRASIARGQFREFAARRERPRGEG